jgi:hypothetical protein
MSMIANQTIGFLSSDRSRGKPTILEGWHGCLPAESFAASIWRWTRPALCAPSRNFRPAYANSRAIP